MTANSRGWAPKPGSCLTAVGAETPYGLGTCPKSPSVVGQARGRRTDPIFLLQGILVPRRRRWCSALVLPSTWRPGWTSGLVSPPGSTWTSATGQPRGGRDTPGGPTWWSTAKGRCWGPARPPGVGWERSWGQLGNIPDLFLGLPRCLHGPNLGSVSVQHQRGASVLQLSILPPVLEAGPEEEVRLWWSRIPGGGPPPRGDLGVPKASSHCGHFWSRIRSPEAMGWTRRWEGGEG